MFSWQKILLDLRANGVFITTVAKKINIHPKTLQKAARYGIDDLPYFKAIKLLELHEKVCK